MIAVWNRRTHIRIHGALSLELVWAREGGLGNVDHRRATTSDIYLARRRGDDHDLSRADLAAKS